MKHIMDITKREVRFQQSITSIADAGFNWDSFETKALFYTEEIKKYQQSLNQLSLLGDAKKIISLCGKIKAMRQKLRSRK